jgi:hypothetical protein
MASGLPVLATEVGGNSNWWRPTAAGAFLRAGRRARARPMLADYVGDPVLTQRHAQQARRRAVECFGLGAMVSSYQSVYERLCGTAAEAVVTH